MGLLEVTYEIKLLSSKDVRDSLNKNFPMFCREHNCECTIDIKKKWYWLHDVYVIKVIGENDDIKYIQKQLKYLTTLTI